MTEQASRASLKGMARWLGAGVAGGLVSGFTVGGIGGRLAMFLLRLTTGPKIHGLKSDDEFIMGKFSSASGFLILLATFLGALGGLIYVGIRGFVPDRFRAAVATVLAGLVIGSLVIHPDGVDFTVVKPHWLAIALFIMLPAAFGFFTSRLVENLGSRTSNRALPWLALVALPAVPALLGVSGSLFMPLVLLCVAGLAVAATRVDAVSGLYSAPVVIWAGRTALAAAGAWAATQLARDAISILA